MSALASLNADYSDSDDELEEGHRARHRQDDSDDDGDAGRRSKEPPASAAASSTQITPSSVSGSVSARSTPTKKMRLVSYTEEGVDDDDDDAQHSDENDDNRISDDDDNTQVSLVDVGKDRKSRKKDEDLEEDPSGVVPMDLESESSQDAGESGNKDSDSDQPAKETADEDTLNSSHRSGVEVEAWSGLQLPPEPVGFCSDRVQKFFAEQWKKKQQDPSYDFNKAIYGRKKFRNPSIYEKLIEFCNIDEHGTNFPKELYDGHLFGKESYYKELDKVQAAEMKRREKAAEKRRAHSNQGGHKDYEHHSGMEDLGAQGAVAASNIATKRRSKWDQGGPAVALPAPMVMGQGPSKTISAFGPLKK